MDGYTYRGRRVHIPRTVDMPSSMRPHGRFADFVQQTIDAAEPWGLGEDPIETRVFPGRWIPSIVAPVPCDVERIWALHRGHKAQRPKASPFIPIGSINREDLCVKCVTVELSGSAEKPMLVRAYPGDYIPPLPWMTSAKWADGGIEACKGYWQTHAYIVGKANVGDLVPVVPEWFVH